MDFSQDSQCFFPVYPNQSSLTSRWVVGYNFDRFSNESKSKQFFEFSIQLLIL